MEKQSLNGQWQLRQIGTTDWKPAHVPGSVHLDLMAIDEIPDPFLGANEEKVQWIIEQGWEYQHRFAPLKELLAQEKILLRFDGIDTIADVFLNDTLLGNVENMFRVYEFEVQEYLLPKENILTVRFSPLKTCIENIHSQKKIQDTTPMGIEGGQYIRKAPCQFGWDWGPALPPVGIWKDVALIGISHPRFADIHLRQHHANDTVTVTADITLDFPNHTELVAEMSVIDPEGRQYHTQAQLQVNAKLNVLIENPQRWFPAGYGRQPLYTVKFSLKSDDEIVDSRTYRIGLRTIELRQDKDEWGTSFTFVVNGIPIFAKGSNWIPADSFPTRLTRERLEKWIVDAVASHHNMLRVWGGGFYETEDFYDLCDEYGILVWQDFVFACKIYPLDDKDFIANIQQEVIENVARLRHRASLALWCGNNEMEMGWETWRWDRPENARLKSAYDIFFHHLLPGWVEELDPDTQYWPSSPSSDQPFIDTNGQAVGDAHYWDVWHGGQPFTAYRNQYPRFMSEFGFQAFPTLETINAYAHKEEQNLTSYVMELHQKNQSGNRLIINQMTASYRIPNSFDKLMYASHILQAEGIRYGVEHWRRNKQRVSGTLYWQLNDCWPVASWASIDYFGRWKALHYATKKFYAPILMSIFDQNQHVGVWLTSDSLTSWNGEIKWQLATVTGEVLQSGTEQVSVSPQESREMFALDFQLSKEQKMETVFIAELWKDEQLLTTRVVPFLADKHVNYQDPNIKAALVLQGDKLQIRVHAQHLARFVEVKLANIDTVFSDNYFDIPANAERIITCEVPDGYSLADLENNLSTMDLYHSYQE